MTQQKRTMDAADALYGVSMGGDGVRQWCAASWAGTIEEAAA